jgi:hypothetical protein
VTALYGPEAWLVAAVEIADLGLDAKDLVEDLGFIVAP